VLERRAPPTFDVLIEIKDRQHMVIHHNVAAAVDAILRDRPLLPEERVLSEDGQMQIQRYEETGAQSEFGGRGRKRRIPESDEPRQANTPGGQPGAQPGGAPSNGGSYGSGYGGGYPPSAYAPEIVGEDDAPRRNSVIRIYPYGIGQNRLRTAASTLKVPVQIVDNLNTADAVMTIKNYYRQQPAPILEAERRNIPIYILRSNTVMQMEQCLVDIFHIPSDPVDIFDEAMRETQEGIQRVLNGSTDDIELSPQSPTIRSQQHQLARAANLISHSYGREPYRRVRIFRK
jgi:hypothetical protein